MAVMIADTDVFIDFLRSKGVADEVERELERGALSTTSITAFELWAGARTAREQSTISNLLEAVKILVLDKEAAKSAAEVRRLLEKQGLTIGMADSLIAGICLTHRGVLFTRNIRHFERISGLILR